MATSVDTVLSDLSANKKTIIAETQLQLSSRAGLMNYIWTQDLAGQGSNAANFPIFSNLSAYEVNEGVQSTQQGVSTSSVTITATMKQVSVAVTDQTLLSTNLLSGLVQYIAQEAGDAIGNKYEDDIIAYFPSMTTNDAGANTTDLSYATWSTVNTLVRSTAGVKDANVFSVLSPRQFQDLKNSLTWQSSGAPYALPEGLKNNLFNQTPMAYGFVLDGTPVFTTQRIVNLSTDSDSHNGVIMDKRAIGAVVNKSTIDFEVERVASFNKTIFHFRMFYGVGLVKEAWGGNVLSDGI